MDLAAKPPKAGSSPSSAKVRRLRRRLLAWYDVHARALPWRIGPAQAAAGARADPYGVWLSEVMLQQTTTGHAAPYYSAFLARWPTVQALAAAPEADVMGAWAGLGYYARARSLIACARAVATDHAGIFPDTEEGLRALPGLGPYTAAAVAAIAFGRAANVVDGNVERVISRLFAVEAPLPAAKPELRALASTLVDAAADARHGARHGDWAQALMDLGATVCRPRSPACGACPLSADCQAFAGGAPGGYPRKTPKAATVRRHGVAYVMTCKGRVALTPRPAKGLLGGMLGLPTSEWTAIPPACVPPVSAEWREAGEIDHVFTHFPLTLRVRRAEIATPLAPFAWTPLEEALRVLPTVFAKALRAAVKRLV